MTEPAGEAGPAVSGGSKNLKAIVIKAKKKIVKAADREKWKAAHATALAQIMDERVVTSPRKGGLSVYGTNVLMNMTNVIGGLPAKNSQFTGWDKAEKVSGEYVNEQYSGWQPHLPRLPGGVQEGSRDQRWTVCWLAHGVGRVRASLVCGYKLRQ